MEGAKIRLSQEELELVSRTDWILTKNRILLKAKSLLESIAADQHSLLLTFQHALPPEALNPPAKISKGENYRGLPYLVLDQPRSFHREDVLAIRTMFWWGNFFSITLHLSGHWKDRYLPGLQQSFTLLQDEFYIGCNDDPWEHHFDGDNYKKLETLDGAEFGDLLGKRKFVKLAAKTAISNWETADKDLMEFFGRLLRLLTA